MLQTILLIFTLLLVTNNVSSYMKQKPNWLPTCMFKDKDFIKCSTNATAQLFLTLKNGSEALGVPSLDPFQISNIQISESDTGPMRLSCSVKNVTIIGLGSSKILHNSVDNKTYDFTTNVHIDELTIKGKYDMKGQLLFLPLQGAGDCRFTVRNVSIFARTDADLYVKHGHYFYNVTGVKVKFDFTDLNMYLYNLFNGAKELEKRTNEYFNKNWKPFADVLNPTLSQTTEDILFYFLKRIFDIMPADFWISDIGETYNSQSPIQNNESSNINLTLSN